MYHAPLREMRFVLEELLGAGSLGASPLLADYSDELARSVLEEAARFAETVLDPLNRPGDTHGARWTADGVVTAPGFREAYKQFAAGGWPGLGAAPQFGGQRVPRVLVSAVGEFWGSACLAFKLGPMLTHGAVHALELCGSAAQKERYLPRMISGEWTGTMVLTEPQAGSDLGQVRTRAVPDGDHYRLFGQKIFITWGDHDLTANTLHMVLGRIEGAPPGVRGISLFIVPKVLVNADGSLGARNDVRCLSIEHKLGIHASPTCVLAFGEKNGAVGYLVGEPGRGLEYMFVMMNSARLSVGGEGYAVGARALQRAAEWARTRVQGKPPVAQGAGPAPIINHPDVKRMLLTMKSQTEASRALTLHTAFQFDLATYSGDEKMRRAARRRAVHARRAHHDHLRRHHRHPVERSHRPQARPRSRRRDGRIDRRHGAGAAGDHRHRCVGRCHPQGGAGGGCGAEKRHAGAAQDARFTPRRGHGGVGAVPEVVRLRDRRLAAGEVGGDRRGKAGRSRPRVLCSQDPHRALLRRAGAAGRGGARARGRGRRDERGRDRRRAHLVSPLHAGGGSDEPT